MIVTKVDMRKTGGNLPDGCVRVNLNEPIANFQVNKEMTGTQFVDNLEAVNRQRVKMQNNDVYSHSSL